MIVTLHYVRQRTFVLFLVGAIAYSAGSKMNNETRLLQDLFRGYDMNARPVLNNSDSVKVSLNFQIIRIIELNAKDQYIKVLAWFHQYWNNPLLVWDPENYGGIKTIHVQPKEVWVPDILLYNNLDDKDTMAGGRTTYLTNVALSYDGSNAWLNPALFKSICNIDITNFPFDDQTCKLKFGSWSFSIAGIDSYAWNNTQLSPYYNKNGEWQILDVAVARNVVKYQCCPNAFVDVTVTIDLRRECMDYILKLIIPCSLISSMSFLGFVLPPESGERIGLSITVLLAMTVFQQLSSELMPSYGFPILGQYYFAIILEIGLSLFMTTLILNFYHRNRKMSKYTRKLLLHWLARIAFPWQKSKDWNPASQTEGQSNQQNQENGKQSSDRQRHCSEDSLSFDERLFAYSPSNNDGQNCHMNDINEPSSSAKTPPSQQTEGVETNHAYDNNGMVGSTGAINGVPGNNFPSQSTEETLKGTDISKNPVCLAQMLAIHSGDCLVAPSDAKLENQKDWMKAARVLDRLFLVISVVLTLGTMFAIFTRAPRFQYIL